MRAAEEVERRLAAYRPPETDPALVEEMLAIVRSGMETPAELPALPPLPDPIAEDAGGGRRRNRRRERS
jgi:hypothetical protein